MALPPDFDPDAPADDDGGLYGLPFTADDAAVVILGVPWEATVSYGRGTSRAPAAVLEASKQVDLHDIETGDPWRHGIALAAEDPELAAWGARAAEAAAPVHEAGGVDPADDALVAAAAEVDALAERRDAKVAAFTARILDEGRIPGILGGDHSVPLGAIVTAAERFEGLGILHVDAHADLREAYEGFRCSHASIFHNVLEQAPGVSTLVQVGLRDVGSREAARIGPDPRLHGFFDPDLAWEMAGGTPWRTLVARMLDPLPETVWISFDIDGLDPALCPGTGTPVPGGLSWHQALVLLRALAHSGRRIVGFDLCEVVPGDTEWDANVGARLLYKLAGHALATRPR